MPNLSYPLARNNRVSLSFIFNIIIIKSAIKSKGIDKIKKMKFGSVTVVWSLIVISLLFQNIYLPSFLRNTKVVNLIGILSFFLESHISSSLRALSSKKPPSIYWGGYIISLVSRWEFYCRLDIELLTI